MISASERWRTAMACLVLAASTWCPRAVAAEPYGDDTSRTAARALASQGAVAFEQHDYGQALALFQRAVAIVPAPTIKLMEARTLVELGRWVEALESYGAIERMLALDPSNEAYRDAAQSAAQETRALLERMPTLRVRVEGAAPGETLEIFVDGKQLAPALAAVDRPSDPGSHRVEVRTSRARTTSREVTLNERAHEDVELTLPALAPTPTPDPVASTKTHSSPARTAGWALVASGAAFTGVGALTGVLALNHKSDLDAVCTPGCPPSSSDALGAYRRERAVSYVTFALGGLALAGGTYLVLAHPTRKVALYVTPNLVALGGAFR